VRCESSYVHLGYISFVSFLNHHERAKPKKNSSKQEDKISWEIFY
jgi:hypothetical protein